MSRRSPQMLTQLMQARPAVVMDDLRAALDGASVATVFRYLQKVPYRSSYNHNGSYYTLHDPGKYDRWGLFSAGDVHFSVDGTAQATVVRLVQQAEAGWTQGELQDLMKVRVQPYLLAAVREGLIVRQSFGRPFVYLHADAERREEQRQRRHGLVQAQELGQPKEPATSIGDEVVIRVLLVLLRHPGATPGDIVRHLAGRSPPITRDQIDIVFSRYGLGEKGGPKIY